MAGSIDQALSELDVERMRYLIMGGVAVVLHGHLPTTAALDVVVQLAPDSGATVVSFEDLVALEQAAGRAIDLDDIDALRALSEKEEL